MSNNIDEKIVMMKFNDSDFKRGITSAIRGIDDLRAGLTLENISSGVDNISSKFSAFGAIAFTALQNLTNAAIGFGQRIAGAILDPIIEGGKKRALNIEQAKFQFKGLGMDVEQAMDDALYAVKDTAFGLDEAAVAASQFGASGIKSGDEMKAALRGISGVAAMAGTSYSDIADVFTKVAGQGRLMGDDLNRLGGRGINAAATLAKAFNTTEEDIRKMVSEGKISFQDFAREMSNAFGEQATKANETYSGSLSNMRAALARIGAAFATVDFENQRQIINALTPVIDNVKKALTPVIDAFTAFTQFSTGNLVTMLQAVNEVTTEGQLPDFFQGLANIGTLLVSIFGPIRDAFLDIFPTKTADQIKSMAAAFRVFTEGLKLSEKATVGLKSTFRGLFAAIDIVGIVIKETIDFFGRLLGKTDDAAGGILGFTGDIGEFIVRVRDSLKSGTALTDFFNKIEEILRKVGDGFFAVVGAVKAAFDAFMGFIDIPDWTQFWQGLGKAIGAFVDFLRPVGKWIGEAARNIGDAIKGFLEEFDFSVLVGILNVGAIGALILVIKNFVGGFTKALGKILGGAGGGILDTIKDAFGSLTDTMEAMQARLKSDILIRIAVAIGLLTASVVALSFISPEKLSSALAAMTVMFIQMTGALVLMDKFVTPDKIAKLPALGLALILLGAAMIIFATAVNMLAGLSWEELGKGMASMATGLGIMIGTLYGIKALKLESMGGQAIAIILFATAVVIFASAMKIFATLSWDDIARGMTSLVGVFTILIAVSRLAQSSAQGAAAMFIISAALNVLGAALHIMASLSWDELGRSLLTLGGSLLVMAIGVRAMQGSITGAAAMAIVSVGLLILSKALQELAKLSWDDIGRALVVMAGGLAILAGAMALMGIPLVLLGSVGILAAAVALTMLAPALVLLGSMSWDDIGRGLTVLAGALAILAVGGLLLIVALPGLIGLGVAVLMIGQGALLAGIGLGLMAVGITALAAAATVGGAALQATLDIIVGMIPRAMSAFAQGLIDFAVTIANGGTQITNAISTLITSIVTAIQQNGPLILDTVHGLVMGMLDKIEESVPRFIEVGDVIFMAFLNSLQLRIPAIVNVGMAILQGVLDGIGRRIGAVADSGTTIIVNFIDAIGRNTQRIVNAGMDMVINLVNGVANSIRSNQGRMEAAGQNLAGAIIDGMTGGIRNGINSVINAARDMATSALNTAKAALGIHSPSREFHAVGLFSGEGYAGGVVDSLDTVRKSTEQMGKAALYGVSKSIDQIRNAVATDIQADPTITPILDLSAIRRDAGLIGGMLTAPRLDVSGNYAYASSIASQRRLEEESYEGAGEVASVTNVQNFEQNNFSPKPLSRLEIYRQTQNQLAGAKEVKST